MKGSSHHFQCDQMDLGYAPQVPTETLMQVHMKIGKSPFWVLRGSRHSDITLKNNQIFKHVDIHTRRAPKRYLSWLN